MTPQDVHMFVFDGLSDWEPGYAVVGINSPQFQLNPGRYRVRTVALEMRPMSTMGGIRIEPDLRLDSISPKDSAMLILPGGTTWDMGHHMEAIRTAGTFLSAGVPVAAICGATAALARGGLLDHRRHTSNSREYLAATKYGGASLYEDALAVTDDNLITAPGFAPLEFAQHIFRRLGVFSPQVLDAWYNLFKTGRREYFETLLKASKA